MPTNFESRALPAAELRVEDKDGKPCIRGYAAVFNSMSEDLGGFREVIRPGAFATALEDCDVRALINHDASKVMGRTKAGTCRLMEDSRGLKVEIDPPETQYAKDLMECMRRGDVSGMSFRFYMHSDPARGQTWRNEPSGVVREITEFRAIDDVSIVTYPAYPATEAALRSLAEFQAAAKARPTYPRRNRAERLMRLAGL